MSLRIGSFTDVEDGCVVHAGDPMEIGDNVLIGHGAVVHGRRIGNRVLIGMNATVLEHAEVGDDCVIAAGAVVTEGMVIPPGSFVAGVPAKIKGKVTEEEGRARVKRHYNYYTVLGKKCREQGLLAGVTFSPVQTSP
ncbi:gamma carbonic anhydrase family protein [Chloroflexota bacterium]